MSVPGNLGAGFARRPRSHLLPATFRNIQTLTNVCLLREALAVARTQAERSTAMQQALVEAAIELLIEQGWAATTSVAVCDRVGCTRGALVHHYPDLSALLAHAL